MLTYVLHYSWLKTSVLQPAAQVYTSNRGVYHAVTKCKICGLSRDSFASQRSFSMHLSWCNRRTDINQNQNSTSTSSTHQTQSQSQPVVPLAKPFNDPALLRNMLSTPSNGESRALATITASPVVPSNTTSTTASESVPSHRLLSVFGAQANTEPANSSELPNAEDSVFSDVLIKDEDVDSQPAKRLRVEENSTSADGRDSAMDLDNSSNSTSGVKGSLSTGDNQFPKVNGFVVADKYPTGSHYYSCDVCRRLVPTAVGEDHLHLLCQSCPCVYHYKCAGSAANNSPEWNCPRCT